MRRAYAVALIRHKSPFLEDHVMKSQKALVALSSAAYVLLASCASSPSEQDTAVATKGMVTRKDLEIVDCLLPGQVRQLGNTTYLTQRRPTRTTASDCSAAMRCTCSM